MYVSKCIWLLIVREWFLDRSWNESEKNAVYKWLSERERVEDGGRRKKTEDENKIIISFRWS